MNDDRGHKAYLDNHPKKIEGHIDSGLLYISANFF